MVGFPPACCSFELEVDLGKRKKKVSNGKEKKMIKKIKNNNKYDCNKSSLHIYGML